jgi:UDP-glucuronate decarboxylase
VVQALRGEPITVYGDGAQTRSFCFVSDLIDGFVRLMGSDLEATPVNLGNPDEHTIMDMARRVVALTKSGSTIEGRPLPQDDPVRRKPDITKARRELGWEPRVTLDEGLGATIADFRERMKG